MSLDVACDINFLIKDHVNKTKDLEGTLAALKKNIETVDQKVNDQIDEYRGAEAKRQQILDSIQDAEAKINYLSGCLEVMAISVDRDNKIQTLAVTCDEVVIAYGNLEKELDLIADIADEIGAIQSSCELESLSRLTQENLSSKSLIIEMEIESLTLSTIVNKYDNNLGLRSELLFETQIHQQQLEKNCELGSLEMHVSDALVLQKAHYKEKEEYLASIKRSIANRLFTFRESFEVESHNLAVATEEQTKLATQLISSKTFLVSLIARHEHLVEDDCQSTLEIATGHTNVTSLDSILSGRLTDNEMLCEAIKCSDDSLNCGIWFDIASPSCAADNCSRVDVEIKDLAENINSKQHLIDSLKRDESLAKQLSEELHYLITTEIAVIHSNNQQKHALITELAAIQEELFEAKSQRTQIEVDVELQQNEIQTLKQAIDLSRCRRVETEAEIAGAQYHHTEMDAMINSSTATHIALEAELGLLSEDVHVDSEDRLRVEHARVRSQEALAQLTAALNNELGGLREKLASEDKLFQQFCKESENRFRVEENLLNDRDRQATNSSIDAAIPASKRTKQGRKDNMKNETSSKRIKMKH